jgi:6-pyruvoyltetrahydropterin/6-carboxytetrahydropterin synthase
MKVSIYRQEQFNAAHRLYNKNWDAAKNNEVFGLCNNENFHGHNYKLIVKVTGEIDKETGYVMDTKNLSKIILDEIIEAYDHKNLNMDCDEFKNLIPTVENIAVVIWKKLRKHIPQDKTLKIKLYETPRNYVSYAGE